MKFTYEHSAELFKYEYQYYERERQNKKKYISNSIRIFHLFEIDIFVCVRARFVDCVCTIRRGKKDIRTQINFVINLKIDFFDL